MTSCQLSSDSFASDSNAPTLDTLERPKVSVSVISYNHQEYIGDCLESILEQQVDFPIEIIVGDDASRDATQAIIADYQRRYPGIIRSILRERNTGGTENYYGVVAMCKGEYIAHIDGDDRMLPGKLARQVTFLDAHPECSMVVHKANVIRASDGRLLGKVPHNTQPPISDLDYLVQNYQFFVGSSAMYRRSANTFPARSVPTVDLIFHMEHAASGKIGYLDEVLVEYRRVTNSITSDVGHDRFRASVKGSLDAFQRALELGVSPEVVDQGLRKFNAGVSLYYLEVGKLELFLKFLNDSVVGGRYVGFQHQILYKLRKVPSIVRLLYRAYKAMRTLRTSL